MRVVIPFGPRKISGYVVKRIKESSYDHLKEIIDVLDVTPVLTKELLKLGKWLANETVSLYITTYQAMLPQVLKSTYKKEVIRLTDIPLIATLENAFKKKDVLSFEETIQLIGSYKKLQHYIESGD